MVILRGLAQRARDGLSSGRALPILPGPGLITYQVHCNGGYRRLHLRVEHDGTGVLFRDVTDVVHLNVTATALAKLALDGVPLAHATALLHAATFGASRSRIAAEAADIYRLVDVMQHAEADCPTCALPHLPRAALFSTPIHAPYKADLALTYGCNNACPHCYNEPSRYPMASLGKSQWFQVIDRLHEVGVPHIILTGGEATLHPDLLHIIRYADGRGHIVGLNTNGRRLAHKPFVAQLAESGLNHVQITLGSSRPDVHDAMMGAHAFEQTVAGLSNAIASPLHTITNTTLTRANMDHTEEIVDFLDDLGIRTFAMNGLIHTGGGFANPAALPEAQLPGLLIRIRDQADRLGMRFLWYTPTEYCRMSPVELELGAKRCNAGEYSMCVEPNGDVLPCQSFYVTAGNILRDPWPDLWNGDLFRSFRNRIDDPKRSGLPPRCWDCPDLPACGGGCRIEREARDGLRSAGDLSASACTGCSPRPLQPSPAKPQPISLIDEGFAPRPPQADTMVRGSGSLRANTPQRGMHEP